MGFSEYVYTPENLWRTVQLNEAHSFFSRLLLLASHWQEQTRHPHTHTHTLTLYAHLPPTDIHLDAHSANDFISCIWTLSRRTGNPNSCPVLYCKENTVLSHITEKSKWRQTINADQLSKPNHDAAQSSAFPSRLSFACCLKDDGNEAARQAVDVLLMSASHAVWTSTPT